MTGPATPSPRRRATGQTDYLTVVQNWGAQAGARTNHLCLDLYDLPQIPHRIARGARRRRPVRHPRGRVPVLPARPRRGPARRTGSSGRTPTASRSRRAPRARRSRSGSCPRQHEADFGRADDADVAATAEALRQVLGRLAASLDGPPYNLVLHTAPLREQVDATYHWHWEIHPRLREIAGLELGTGLPVNPVSPEDAVEELLGRAEPRGGGSG